jgi:hypothetical protein
MILETKVGSQPKQDKKNSPRIVQSLIGLFGQNFQQVLFSQNDYQRTSLYLNVTLAKNNFQNDSNKI